MRQHHGRRRERTFDRKKPVLSCGLFASEDGNLVIVGIGPTGFSFSRSVDASDPGAPPTFTTVPLFIRRPAHAPADGPLWRASHTMFGLELPIGRSRYPPE
jgi:hypothetical protein